MKFPLPKDSPYLQHSQFLIPATTFLDQVHSTVKHVSTSNPEEINLSTFKDELQIPSISEFESLIANIDRSMPKHTTIQKALLQSIDNSLIATGNQQPRPQNPLQEPGTQENLLKSLKELSKMSGGLCKDLETKLIHMVQQELRPKIEAFDKIVTEEFLLRNDRETHEKSLMKRANDLHTRMIASLNKAKDLACLFEFNSSTIKNRVRHESLESIHKEIQEKFDYCDKLRISTKALKEKFSKWHQTITYYLAGKYCADLSDIQSLDLSELEAIKLKFSSLKI